MYIADSDGVRDIYDTEGRQAISTTEPLAVLVGAFTLQKSIRPFRGDSLLFGSSQVLSFQSISGEQRNCKCQ